MNRTHLIIPCTAQKAKISEECLEISQVKSDKMDQTIEAWLTLSATASKTQRADQLYLGQAFKRLKRLSVEHKLELHIMSAGFGLVSADTQLPNYNVTFSESENRVPLPTNDWWNSISAMSSQSTNITDLISAHSDDNFIVCASNEYLNAIQDDLLLAFEKVEKTSQQITVVSISVPKKLVKYEAFFLRASEQVFSHPQSSNLGLSKTAQHVTGLTTCLLVEKMSDTNEKLGDIIADLNSYIASLPKPEKPKRKQQSVEYINEFINDYLDSEPKPSKTGAMKAYRDAGNACEQKKFHGYYQEQINKR